MLGCVLVLFRAEGADVPVATTSNVAIRVMAANLTGNSQTYEADAMRIFQGLKPDVVAIQEFNYLGNTAGDLRTMVNTAFGTNFSYYRETGYSIPNGIISRWPIAAAGSWEDVDAGVNDRGFAWARIDLPGSNDLYVVSLHLKSSSGATNEFRRNAEAAQVKSLIQSNFPANAWMVVAGDGNIQSPDEAALATFKTFLLDSPIPTDLPAGGDADTNNGRSERYDYVLPSPAFNTNRVTTRVGSRSFPNGLVFDSRIFSPLTDVAPVQAGDSTNLQHMAVIKDFQITFSVTNLVAVPRPQLRLVATNILRWEGLSHLTYTVEGALWLTNWQILGSASSSTTNFSFTNQTPSADRSFYRVVYP
jgi:endonuclease/exonuclease/phosphatase family metal-dependent hydrolase